MRNRIFNLRVVWGIFMLGVYFGMAYLLTFTKMFDFKFEIRLLLGISFFLYGLSRAYRIWKYNQ